MQADTDHNASHIKVFISHAHRDRDQVFQLIVNPLEAHNIPTWVDRSDIHIGDSWEQSIRQGLKGSAWFLVAISPCAIESRWVRAEVQWALREREGRIVPVIIAPCDPAELNLLLVSLQHVDFVMDAACALRQLLALWGRHVRDDTFGPREQNDQQAPSKAFQAGKLFLGRYQMKENIGRGRLYTVFKVHDQKLDRPMILKEWPEETVSSEQSTYMDRERRIQSRLNLAGVVGVHDFGATWMVQDYLQGKTLEQLLQVQSISIREATIVLAKMARILHRVHSHGIVHSDIKPINILVDEYGDPHLLDFCKALEISEPATGATTNRKLLRANVYTAPEALRSPARLDGRADLYALGVILYEIIAGKRLSYNDELDLYILSQSDLAVPSDVQNIPKELVCVCNKCVRRNPDERFATGEELALQMEACLQLQGMWT